MFGNASLFNGDLDGCEDACDNQHKDEHAGKAYPCVQEVIARFFIDMQLRMVTVFHGLDSPR